jgi:hypothetical protein
VEILFSGVEFDNRADIILVEVPGSFLAITCDEWYSRTLESEF